MIQVIGQCVQAGNEPGARQLFDVLETLLILVKSPTTCLIQRLTILTGSSCSRETYPRTCVISAPMRG